MKVRLVVALLFLVALLIGWLFFNTWYTAKANRYVVVPTLGGLPVMYDKFTGKSWRVYTKNNVIAGWTLLPFQSDQDSVISKKDLLAEIAADDHNAPEKPIQESTTTANDDKNAITKDATSTYNEPSFISVNGKVIPNPKK